MAVWSNARVLHGRESYVGARHLQGAYLDSDAIRSTVCAALSEGLDLDL